MYLSQSSPVRRGDFLISQRAQLIVPGDRSCYVQCQMNSAGQDARCLGQPANPT